VDIAPIMVWMSGPDGRCTFFNKRWLQFSGLSLEDQLDQDWVAQVHPEDRERSVSEYLSAFKSRQNFTLEYRLLRNDGLYRWVVHNGAPRYAPDGNFLGYTGSRIDFTERRLVAERLREVSTQRINEQEIESVRIGHELSEDLAQKVFALSMRLSRFSRKYIIKGGEAEADLDQVQQQLRDLCHQIVCLSRQLRPVNVEALGLSAALRSLCGHAADEERSVLFVADESLPLISEEISRTLYRVAEEALRNALMHSGADCIHIELGASETSVRLSVRDNGCGFVIAITKMGLGLSGMSEYMKTSGGEFSIISSPGEGTTVIATMPLKQSMSKRSTA